MILIGVPQTYPPRPVNGLMVTDFLTPSIASNYTYPPELKDEIAGLPDVHPYEFDVSDFRTPDKGKIRDSLVRMTDKRFALARHLLTTKPWDFFMMVEMGTDRVHHAFWQYMDPAHHRYEPGNPFESVIADYYEHVDRKIGELLEVIPDDAHVLVVSDHGAQCMEGGIALNEWLIQKGYLVLQEPSGGPSRLEAVKIDWAQDDRLGLGRLLRPALPEREGARAAGADRPGGLRGDPRPPRSPSSRRSATPRAGRSGPACSSPRTSTGRSEARRPPDLFVYFGDLRWRSVGTVGTGQIHTFENDTGPDDANHAARWPADRDRPGDRPARADRGHAADGRHADDPPALRPRGPRRLARPGHRRGHRPSGR